MKSFSNLPDIPDDAPAQVLEKGQISEVSNRGIKNIERNLKPFRQIREIVAGGNSRWKPINIQAARMFMKGEKIHDPPQAVDLDNMTRHQNLNHNLDMAAGGIKLAKKTMSDLKKLAEEAEEAKKLLEDMASTWRKDVLEFTKDIPKAIEEVRNFRMTVSREKQLSMDALEDLRKFFLSSDHDTEMIRLKDFVRTCEKLQVLSYDGILERVADVLRKLEGQ